jgi:photosystem II oxygen-evolving enhancer protein 2
MFKRIFAILLIVVSISLQGCAVSGAAGFKSYIDSIDGYRFLYPNGWSEVNVTNGADIVFHDLIEPSENVSVVLSPVSDPDKKTLTQLGSPGEVGYQIGKKAIAPPDSGRQAELVNAESHEIDGKTYYLLEYAVKIGDRQRHNLASAVINRGKLYTFNASTTEQRWEKVRDLLYQSVQSFSVD